MKKFIEKHCVLFSILVIIAALAGGFMGNGSMGRYVVAVLLITFMSYLKFEETYFFRLEGVLKTIVHCSPILLVVVLGNAANALMIKDIKWDRMPDIKTVLLFLIAMLGVGLFEESLMRGTVFNCMKGAWAAQPNGLMKAAIISSMIFGMLHIINFIENPVLLLGTIAQVIYAASFGLYFCGTYVKEKNFIGIVIIHGLVDTLGEGMTLFSSSYEQIMVQDISGMECVIELLICVPFAYWGIRDIRVAEKKETETSMNC